MFKYKTWGIFDDNYINAKAVILQNEDFTCFIIHYDCCRDPRGFSVKFYTEDGIWDLVGNNTPIFFLRDPILFPLFIHSQKRNPATNLRVM